MIIPATAQTFQWGKIAVKLMIPNQQWVRQTYETAANPQHAFWAKPWPAALALAKFIATEPQWVEHKTVVELAAGLALPGLTAAHFAQQVLLSDYLLPPVANMEASIQVNGFSNCTTACINWQAIPNTITPEVLLLSDICYNPADFTVLEQMIRQFLNRGTTLLLSTPHRLAGKSFMASLQTACIYQCVQTVEDTAVSIWVLR